MNIFTLSKYTSGGVTKFSQATLRNVPVRWFGSRLGKNRKLPVPVFLNALDLGERLAIKDENGTHTYQDLALKSFHLADCIKQVKSPENGDTTIAFITDNDAHYTICTWAVWILNSVAVPLCKTHPIAELEHVVEDSHSSIVLSSQPYNEIMSSITCKFDVPHIASVDDITAKFSKEKVLNDVEVYKKSFSNGRFLKRDAVMVYTSGTTGKPKGVVWKHRNLWSQVQNMIDSWKWTEDDVILHVLPLHHIHGMFNALYCPLTVGASVTMHSKFDTKKVWDTFLSSNQPSVFMAVPTIYIHLLHYYEKHLHDKQEEVKLACSKIRLMVSGSAALPASIHKRWEDATTINLLERFGMTEVGMALTNPYTGTRKGGFVGMPFPNMEAKIVHESDETKDLVVAYHETINTLSEDQQSGTLLIKGHIFDRYWGKEEVTKHSFTDDGWFITGDSASLEDEAFKILGRTSVDIIKSSGYKISALDVERQLLDHPAIDEVFVVGLSDHVVGQKIAAVIVKNDDEALSLESLQEWCFDKMAKYKIPREIKLMTDVPKNSMGKVNKKELVKLF